MTNIHIGDKITDANGVTVYVINIEENRLLLSNGLTIESKQVSTVKSLGDAIIAAVTAAYAVSAEKIEEDIYHEKEDKKKGNNIKC